MILVDCYAKKTTYYRPPFFFIRPHFLEKINQNTTMRFLFHCLLLTHSNIGNEICQLNHAGASPSSQTVIDRVVEHMELEEAIGGYAAAQEASRELAEVFALKQYEAFPENPTTWFITEDNYAVLHQAVSFLIEARQFLRNTYVMSFALRRQTILLVEHECHQGALETLIERLSQLTELNLQRLYQENGEQYVMNHFKKISFYQLAIAKYMERILDFGSSTDIN